MARLPRDIPFETRIEMTRDLTLGRHDSATSIHRTTRTMSTSASASPSNRVDACARSEREASHRRSGSCARRRTREGGAAGQRSKAAAHRGVGTASGVGRGGVGSGVERRLGGRPLGPVRQRPPALETDRQVRARRHACTRCGAPRAGKPELEALVRRGVRT